MNEEQNLNMIPKNTDRKYVQPENLILYLSTYFINQLQAASEVVILPMLCLLHNITNKQYKKLNTVDTENTGGKHALPEGNHISLLQRHIVLSAKRTGTQRRTNDTRIVHTADGERVRLRMKQHQTVKKSSLPLQRKHQSNQYPHKQL